MMSKLFKWSSFSIILITVVGIISLKVLIDNRANDAIPLDLSGSQEGVGSGAEHAARNDIEGYAEQDFSPILVVDEDWQSNPVEDIFNFELSLLEGIERIALSGEWGYDRKVKNVAVWEGLCLANEEKISALIRGHDDANSVQANLSKLCQDFSSVTLEIDEFLDVEDEERAAGVNERAALETSLEDLGPDAATVLAISELSRALESFDYATALEVVWFLGIYNFESVSPELSVYRNQPGVETIFAVAASIFCNSIRGCGRNHPVVLNLCFQFHDLPCFRRPADVYDAADQILTGYELETFSEMNRSLISLLNRYRRGDL